MTVGIDDQAKLREQFIQARKSAGLTQVGLAERLGRPQSFVSTYERGERKLDVIDFCEVCRALGIDPVVFLPRFLQRGIMKIVKTYSLKSRGPYAVSEHWKTTRGQIHEAIRECEWPAGTGSFTIYPESGKKRGKGNGVKPIRDRFVHSLEANGWTIEGKAKSALNERLGDFDAVLLGPEKPIVLEWQTGDSSSPHWSIDKMVLLLKARSISAGVLVVPSWKACLQLPNRIDYIGEIEPYFELWQSVRCRSGVLAVVVIEQDIASKDIRRMPNGAQNRALV